MKHGPFGLRLFLAVGSLGALYLTFIRRSSFWAFGETYYSLFDDAMVSFRYAKNFAEGAGLVWNPGEPAVEGYTNFLWTLLLSGIHLLPIPESKLSLVVMFLGVGILLGCALVGGLLAWRLSQRERAFWIAFFGIGLFYPLVFWTLRGMEVGLVALLMIASLLVVDQPSRARPWTLGILLSFLWFTRPDTVVFSGVLLGASFLLLSKKEFAISSALFAFSLLALTLFRWSYYGELVPNTYFLKVGGAGTFQRWQHGFFELLPTLGQWIFWIALGIFARNTRRALLWAVFGFQALYSIHVGGDAWSFMGFSNRYLTVALPVLAVLFAIEVSRLSRPWAFSLSLLAIAWTNGRAYDHWLRYNFHHYYNDQQKVVYGLTVRHNTAPQARIAVVWAGALPYFARRSAIDLLGKNDPVIAKGPIHGQHFYPGHMKWDYRYSVGEKRPDLITALWKDTPQLQAQLKEWGYEPGAESFWIRSDSPLIGRALKRHPLKNPLRDGSHPQKDPAPHTG